LRARNERNGFVIALLLWLQTCRLHSDIRTNLLLGLVACSTNIVCLRTAEVRIENLTEQSTSKAKRNSLHGDPHIVHRNMSDKFVAAMANTNENVIRASPASPEKPF